MGYDLFALIAIAHDNISRELLDAIAQVCEKLREQQTFNEVLFGEVHRLELRTFQQQWFNAFDKFIMALFVHTNISPIYLYTCESDGEILTRYIYNRGVRVGLTRIGIGTTDAAVDARWHIDALVIRGNITTCYNNDYAA